MNCKNCGLPVEPIYDPWGGGPHGYHHPTIEREANIDGSDVRVYATFCPDDLGEAEPDLGLIGSTSVPYSGAL